MYTHRHRPRRYNNSNRMLKYRNGIGMELVGTQLWLIYLYRILYDMHVCTQYVRNSVTCRAKIELVKYMHQYYYKKTKSIGTRLWNVGISSRETIVAAIFFGRLPGHKARLEKASSGFVFIAYNISDIRAHENTCRVLKTGSSAWARPPVYA